MANLIPDDRDAKRRVTCCIATTGVWTYLDGVHEWVVAVLEQLDTELTQEGPDAESGPPRQLHLGYRSPVLWPLFLWFVVVKGDVFDVAKATVKDDVSVAD